MPESCAQLCRLSVAKRRNTQFSFLPNRASAVIDALQRAAVPMTTRETADALLAGKKPRATQAAVLALLRKRNGGTVLGDGPRGKWRVKETAN